MRVASTDEEDDEEEEEEEDEDEDEEPSAAKAGTAVRTIEAAARPERRDFAFIRVERKETEDAGIVADA